MRTTLYAKQVGKPWIITVSLLMHKPIEQENLLADEFNLPPKFWKHFTDAFRSINSEPVNGFMFDPKLTDGLLAVHTSRIGLEEMIRETESA